MASPTPRRFPFDDDDRPSGSVRPLNRADLQAILTHLSDDRDQLLAGTSADRPVVAVRVRATVGRPGGSAQARWRRLRAAELAAWARTLPWRLAVILGIGAGGGVLGSVLAPRLGLVVAGLAAVAAGWGLRFRPSPDAVAWRRGVAGERHTARLLGPLERHGWAVLHDLAVPGSRVNIDHLALGPGGVFVIDIKQYRGRLRLNSSGRLWHGRYPLAPAVRAVGFEADQAAQVLPDPGMAVVPIVAVHGAQVPWGKVVTDGVPVVPARRLPSVLHALPAVLGPERVAGLADQARLRFSCCRLTSTREASTTCRGLGVPGWLSTLLLVAAVGVLTQPVSEIGTMAIRTDEHQERAGAWPSRRPKTRPKLTKPTGWKPTAPKTRATTRARSTAGTTRAGTTAPAEPSGGPPGVVDGCRLGDHMGAWRSCRLMRLLVS
jgi:Nuclease-related domain